MSECVCVKVCLLLLQQIAQSLQAMLDYEGDDFEETFMASFQVSFSDMFDNVQTVDLREGGRQIPVTLGNRKVRLQYVYMYMYICLSYFAHLVVHGIINMYRYTAYWAIG